MNKGLDDFRSDESAIVWGMIVVVMTLVCSMLIFAVMGMLFDEMYTVAHPEEGSNNGLAVHGKASDTFDTMYKMVDYVPIVILFSLFMFVLLRAIMQEQY